MIKNGLVDSHTEYTRKQGALHYLNLSIGYQGIQSQFTSQANKLMLLAFQIL